MSLRLKYALFIFFIHTVIAVLVYQLLEEQKVYFILAEVGILISLFLSYLLYRSFIRPLQFLYSGIDAIRDKDFNVKFVKTGAKEMDKLIEVYNKMIDNIRIERTQVQEQHFFLMKLINASPAGILILNYDGLLTDANPKAIEILQLPKEHLNKSLSAFNNSVLDQVSEMEINTSAILSTDGIEKYKCQVSNFIHKGFDRKFILIQELSKEILDAEKRAYGKIIRMMAHEVNNSIGAINSILHTMADFFKTENSEWTEPLGIAIERNDRMNQFMRNFAKVVRLPEPNREPTEINQLVSNIGKLMTEQAKAHNIDIVFHLNRQPIYVLLDPQQIEQGLVNIIKNAIESIEENGKIEIITTEHPSTIIIRDNGLGLSKEAEANIFTPFYSSKKDGQGVGLTLIKEILLGHDAHFSLKTDHEGWTAFTITF